MRKLRQAVRASAPQGTEIATHASVYSTGVARLGQPAIGVIHRHRGRFGQCGHAEMWKVQHEEQRKHEAQAKQHMAQTKDAIFIRHFLELGRELPQIK